MIKSPDHLVNKYPVQLEEIRMAMAKADEAYKKLPPEQRRVHRKRTRADQIADYFYDNLLGLDDPLLRLFPRYGTLRIIINDEYQLTFKKLNHSLQPSYWPKWFFPEESEGNTFRNMPNPTTNVVAGYRYEILEQSCFYLVCPSAKFIIELSEPEPELVEEQGKVDQESPEPPKRKRVFPKNATKNEIEEETRDKHPGN
jgi:hypothetical protein